MGTLNIKFAVIVESYSGGIDYRFKIFPLAIRSIVE
jgi:hypothetical protein